MKKISDRKKKISDRQKNYADEYLVDLDATAAAVRSGYAPFGSSKRTLKLPKVASYISEKQKNTAEKLQITTEWVLMSLVSVYNRCTQIEGVYNKNGDLVKGKFDAASALKALDLIGKHMDVQAFRNKVEITDGDGSPVIMWGIAQEDGPPKFLKRLDHLPLEVKAT